MSKSKSDGHSESAQIERQGSIPIPSEHQAEVDILFNEMTAQSKILRRAEDKYLEAHDCFWDRIRELLGPGYADSKLVYDSDKKIVVVQGKTLRELRDELTAQRAREHNLIQEVKQLKRDAVAAQKYESANVFRDFEKLVRDFLVEVEAERQRFHDAADRLPPG